MQFLRKIIRLFCTGSHRSTVPTGFLPLSETKTAVVFTSQSEPGLDSATAAARKFFADRGITVRFISAADKNIRTQSDLFIAINAHKSIDERYAARSSTARFKLGRHQLRRQVYDILVTDATDEPASQDKAFKSISDILTTIK